LTVLRQALAAWQNLPAPYEAACTRVRSAQACRELRHHDTAAFERHQARTTFEAVGAAFDLARLHGRNWTLQRADVLQPQCGHTSFRRRRRTSTVTASAPNATAITHALERAPGSPFGKPGARIRSAYVTSDAT
jgi:hypothetical protein